MIVNFSGRNVMKTPTKNNCAFTGTYKKTVENPDKLFNKKNLEKNPYLMSDFCHADLHLMSIAEKLGKKDVIELCSKNGDLKLIITSDDKVVEHNLGIQEGLKNRLFDLIDTIKKELYK